MNNAPLMARYNAWANRELYGCCADLPDDVYRADKGAFFGSVHNTLNHILVVDRLWLGRMEGSDPGINSLDEILYDDFTALRVAQSHQDVGFISYVDLQTDERLAEVVDYHRSNGTPGSTPRGQLLATLFNHQTHHRGQITTLLTQAGITPPPLDVIVYLSAEG